MKNNWMQRNLYELRKRYSKTVTFYYNIRETVDIVRGKTSRTKEAVSKIAIVLPTNAHKKFSYDIAFLAANKNFTYGGLFSERMKEVIIDLKKLTGVNLSPTNGSYFVVDGQRYNIKKTEVYDDTEMMSIVGTADPLELPANIFTENVHQTLDINGVGETT